MATKMTHVNLKVDLEFRTSDDGEPAEADVALSGDGEQLARIRIRHHPDGADHHDPAGTRWEIIVEDCDDDGLAFRNMRRYRPTFSDALNQVLAEVGHVVHGEWINFQILHGVSDLPGGQEAEAVAQALY